MHVGLVCLQLASLLTSHVSSHAISYELHGGVNCYVCPYINRAHQLIFAKHLEQGLAGKYYLHFVLFTFYSWFSSIFHIFTFIMLLLQVPIQHFQAFFRRSFTYFIFPLRYCSIILFCIISLVQIVCTECTLLICSTFYTLQALQAFQLRTFSSARNSLGKVITLLHYLILCCTSICLVLTVVRHMHALFSYFIVCTRPYSLPGLICQTYVPHFTYYLVIMACFSKPLL